MKTNISPSQWDQVTAIPNTIIPSKAWLKANLGDAQKIADFGSCYGKTIEVLADLSETARIHGYDFNPVSICFLNDKFDKNNDIFARQANLLTSTIEHDHDAIVAVGFLSCFSRKSMLRLFRNIDKQISVGTSILIIDFPYLPEDKAKNAHYQRGLMRGLPKGSFKVKSRNNLEVTHLNGQAIQNFLRKKGYTVNSNEIVEQIKVTPKGEEATHKVLYLSARK